MKKVWWGSENYRASESARRTLRGKLAAKIKIRDELCRLVLKEQQTHRPRINGAEQVYPRVQNQDAIVAVRGADSSFR
jgi:hypothetical protein